MLLQVVGVQPIRYVVSRAIIPEEKMSSIEITIPEGMHAFIDEQVSRRGYKAADEYLHELIRQAQAQEERAAIDHALHEGLDYGAHLEIDEDSWARKRERVANRRG